MVLKNKQQPWTIQQYIRKQIVWSLKTFGPGKRDTGIIDNIRKELIEIEDRPGDIMEWVDVIILALDGAWRNGHTSTGIIKALREKQSMNAARKWPDWKTSESGKAIGHIRNSVVCEVCGEWYETEPEQCALCGEENEFRDYIRQGSSK